MIAPSTMQPGELFITKGRKGLWGRVFQFAGVDPADGSRVFGYAVDDDSRQLYTIAIEAAMQPTLHDQPAEHAERSNKRTGDLPLTAGQRRRLFALGNQHGFDIDDLRGMTPKGSISALTQHEAAKLIDRLGGKPVIEPRGTVTKKQLGMILHLRDELGMEQARFDAWMQRQFKASLDQIDDSRQASKVIGGLLQMFRTRRGSRARKLS